MGAVYHLLLSDLWNPVGLHWWADQGLHTAMPLLTFVFWLLFAPKQGLSYADVPFWLIYPVGYSLYALARGRLEGWYPYPFLDAKSLGYVEVAINSAVIGAFFALACLAMIALAKRLPSP